MTRDSDGGRDAPELTSVDAGLDARAVTDARPPTPDTPNVDAFCAVRGTTTTTYDLGQCFRVENCCTDVDCIDGLVCNDAGHCVVAVPHCGCVTDADCPVGGFECLTNEVACGICVSVSATCDASVPCPAGQTCQTGYCNDPTDGCTMPASDL